MFANLYIFECGACDDDSVPLFLEGGVSVCVRSRFEGVWMLPSDALPVSQRAQIFICR